MISARRNFIVGTATALAAVLFATRPTLVPAQTRSGRIDVRNFGALGDGSTDDTSAVQAAVSAADGAIVYFPRGKYRVSAIVGISAHLVGDGVGQSTIELSTDHTDSLIIADELRVEGISFSDRGRTSMDHTAHPGVYLFECKDAFRAESCVFLTNRSVLSQSPTKNARWTIVINCMVERVTPPIVGEEDRLNIFACSEGVPLIRFVNLSANELTARSVINATYKIASGNAVKEASAVVENCTFDYIHNSDGVQEVKAIFLQGYVAIVNNNKFIDCFGRHVDILGNYYLGATGGVFRQNEVTENQIYYSKIRSSATGSDNDEAGSIYCRYADVKIIGNRLDFSNLKLSSAGYHGISVRHGYRGALVERNEVIAAKAHAIEADISDAIDTDDCAVVIVSNLVSSVRPTRLPISIANNSKGKTFSSVELRDNLIDYPHNSTGIVFEHGGERNSPFGMRYAYIEGNRNEAFASLDEVDFQSFPFSLLAPNTRVEIRASDERGSRGLSSNAFNKVVERAQHYRCKSVTVVPVSIGAGVNAVDY